ncbi:hypothetical protein CRUP_015548, partial [Coryphaenoides rupestris]
ADDQADLVNGDGLDGHATDAQETVKKPKKKKKSKMADAQLPTDLELEEDDIITDALPPLPLSQQALFSAPLERFHAADRCDTRVSGGSVGGDHHHHGNDDFSDPHRHHPPPSYWTTRDVALRVHGGFRMVGLFSHGFLAGYAVWNMVVVYVLAGKNLTATSDLLAQYHALAYPAQSLSYLLLAISTVAAFDRSPGKESEILHPWVTVNLVVAVLVGLAWLFISTRPETDYTEGYLMSMEIEPARPEYKTEMTA